MSKVADDYIVYKKKNHNSVIWCALYRDNRGQRVAISLSKIKKLIYKDYRKQREPIRSKTEAVKIAEKGLSLDFVKNRLSNKDIIVAAVFLILWNEIFLPSVLIPKLVIASNGIYLKKSLEIQLLQWLMSQKQYFSLRGFALLNCNISLANGM